MGVETAVGGARRVTGGFHARVIVESRYPGIRHMICQPFDSKLSPFPLLKRWVEGLVRIFPLCKRGRGGDLHSGSAVPVVWTFWMNSSDTMLVLSPVICVRSGYGRRIDLLQRSR